MQPIFGYADGIVVDSSAPASQRAGLDTTQNGVPVVNITAPSAGGVSRNNFSDFNVDSRGVILNNSLVIGVSQLGGLLLGNSNFTGGQTARIILNEVTGTGRSNINGATEIFGNKAQYVLANPNGITCNGCGFINTPKVTLSTGIADVDSGVLRGFDVTRGDVRFEGINVNVSGLDAFDIISNTASFAASIYAGGEINVIAGNNYVDYNTKTVTPRPTTALAPHIGIDSSVLGGMYAGKINLVATENGVGVNTQGIIDANAGDIKITANGRIEFKNANAKGDLKVTSTSSIKHSGSSYSTGKTEIIARDDIELADGFTAAKGDIKINSTSLDTKNTASLMAGVDAIISGSDVTFTDNGIGALNIITTGTANNAGLFAGAGITANAGSFNNTGLISSRNIIISANSISNLNNYATGGINAGGNLTLKATSGNVNNSGGALIAGGLVTITTTGSFINHNALVNGVGDITITAASIDNKDTYATAIDGTLIKGILSGGDINISATSGVINNSNGAISADNVTLTASGNLNNSSGLVQAANKITTYVNGIDNKLTLVTTTLGAIIKGLLATGDIELQAGGGVIDNTNGAISGDNITATTTGNFNNNSLVQGISDVSITAANIINDDSRVVVGGRLVSGIIAGGDATLKATSGYISNFRGAIAADGIFTLTAATNLLNNNGYISAFADKESTITILTALNNNTGSILTTGNLNISAASGENQAGGVISTQANLNISIANGKELKNTHGNLYAAGVLSANNINNNSGTIQGVGGVNLDNDSLMDNTEGNIRATAIGAIVSIGKKSILSGFINLKGIVAAMADIDLNIANNYSIDGNITTGGHLDITAWSIINNAIVNATDYINLIATAGSITNNANAKLLSNTSITLDSSGNIKNYGEISGPAITITTSNLNNYSDAVISSASTLDITTGANINNSGRISSIGIATINALTLYNTGGQIAGDSTVNITTTGHSIHNTNGGLLYATGDLILHSPDIENTDSDIYSLEGNIRMELATGTKNTSVTNTSGTIEALSGDIIINTDSFINTKISSSSSTGISVVTPPSTTNPDGSTTYTYDTAWLNDNLTPGDEYYHNDSFGGGYNAWIFRIHGDTSGTIDDASAFLTAGRDIIINTGTFTNIKSQVAANRNINITAIGKIENDAHTYQEWMHYHDANGGYSYNSFQGPGLITEVEHFTVQSTLWFSTPALQTEITSSTIHAGNNLNINGANVSNAGTYTDGKTPDEGVRSSNGATVSVTGLGVDDESLATPYQAVSSSASVDTLRFVEMPTGNGLFKQNTAPGANYLIETNVAFIDMARFLGSGYFLTRIGYTPPSSTKLLGDPFYETRLINQAVFARTGQRYLEQGIGTDFAQMQNLFDNAVTEKSALNLSVGIELTQTQIAALTSDIIWLVNDVVEGQQVLKPVLYLAQLTRDNLKDSGAIMSAGNNLTVIANNAINNNGAITAANDIALTAGSDITNNGGSISAGRNVTLVAASGDIINSAVINRSTNASGSFIREYIASQGNITAGGNLSATAGGDITNTASNITSTGNTTLTAGGDINIDTASLRNRTEITGKHSYKLDDTTSNVASNVNVGGSLSATAGDDIAVLGSIVTAAGNANLNAGKDVNIVAVANEDTHITQTSKSGFMSSSSYSKQVYDKEYQKAELQSGGTLSITSSQDVNLVGANVEAASNINLNAGNGVNIASVTDIHELHEKTTKTGVSPISAIIAVAAIVAAPFTAGASLGVVAAAWVTAAATTADALKGSKSTSTHDSIQTVQVGSDVLAGANLTSVSANDTTLIASALHAGGDINITSGGTTSILSANNTDYVADSTTGKSLLWQSQEGIGHNDETVVHTTMEAGNNVNINATGGVNIDVKNLGTVQESVAELSKQPGLEYLATLQDNPNANFTMVDEAHKNWDYKAQGLTPEGAAILAIVVAVATAGTAAPLSAGASVGTVAAGGATAAGATAATATAVGTAASTATVGAISSLAATASVSLVNNQGDVGKVLKELGSSETVKSVLVSAVTAGAVQGLASATGTTGAFSKLDLAHQAERVAINTVANATVDSAINGTDLGKNLTTNLKTSLVNAVGADAAGVIGAQNINAITAAVAHAAVGCAEGAAGGGGCSAGAIGAAAGEIIARQQITTSSNSLYQNAFADGKLTPEETRELITGLNAATQSAVDMAKMAGALAALASGEDAKGINAASNTAAIAAENNATSLQQKAIALLVAGEAAVVAIESVVAVGGGTAAVGGTVCAASGVCALVVGTAFIGGVAYAVIASDNKADIEGFSVAGAQPPLPGFEPTKAKGFVDQGVAVNDSKPDVEGFNAVDPSAGTKDEGFSILPDWAKSLGNALFSKEADVKTLDVGTYGELAPKSNGDGLTPDHIPSFAAIRQAREAELGRELNVSEERELRSTTNCIIYGTCTHQQESRTYGGRNTAAQIKQDAQDLGAAQERDLQAIRDALINQGNSPKNVDAAFDRLRELNKK